MHHKIDPIEIQNILTAEAMIKDVIKKSDIHPVGAKGFYTALDSSGICRYFLLFESRQDQQNYLNSGRHGELEKLFLNLVLEKTTLTQDQLAPKFAYDNLERINEEVEGGLRKRLEGPWVERDD